MKTTERERREKQARAWLEEMNDLYTQQRNRDIIELAKPQFRGYTLNFRLTPTGEDRLSDRMKQLFHLKDPVFFIKDKITAKALRPNLEDSLVGDHYTDPDTGHFNIGYLWPLVFYTREGNTSEFFDKGIYSFEINYRFKIVKRRKLFNGDELVTYALKIPEDCFELEVKKYKQKRAWVEDAYIDSRLAYLRKKLFDEKNWHKYGPEASSYRRSPGKQPEGLYYQEIVGMSPSYPYKRAAQKEQTQNIIENQIKKDEL